ncbi:MAG: patatin [Flavobacteriales bacterium MED-G22]|nr:patatin-like phospholipase family protein [Flavobacteriaceae bacterium]PDH43465.1 MAG: patatin [Flavobacteriales bacterium MED-G22]|tara:strand:+ start:1758 stop:2645 length:888 start_codon:yes stop_codon:yes gene_type:complete
MKRALVISGGGSKGAFAGGIAQFLLEESQLNYDFFIGTSTGSLLISHLALGKVETIKRAYTNVTQESIFDNCPFLIKQQGRVKRIKIHHFNVLKNFIRGRKTFGESNNLRKLLTEYFSITDFQLLKNEKKEVVVCVSNLSTNRVEYKRLHDFEYEDFLDWIWISCNYVPFMSLVVKDHCEYADGGLGSVIPIEEAVRRGATHVDAILLDTEFQQTNRVPSRNPFEALSSVFGFISDKIEQQNLHIGNLVANDYGAKLRIFYTPRILTRNSLVFDRHQMTQWWEEGFDFAKKKMGF